MDEHNNADHLNSSLTDLMTSLMVIFILLLLVFVNRSATKDKVLADVLLKELRKEMIPQGFSEATIHVDERDPNAILLIVPDRLMNFDSAEATLKPEGKSFLETHIPHIAEVLCGARFRNSVESIVVEGHTDRERWRDMKEADSRNSNLKLSQDRSMAVIQEALGDLSGKDSERDCFLEKLSATGRGEQDYNERAPPGESRRVIFRIRVKAKDAVPVTTKMVLP